MLCYFCCNDYCGDIERACKDASNLRPRVRLRILGRKIGKRPVSPRIPWILRAGAPK